MALETELKLRIAPQDADRLARHPLVQAVADSRRLQHLQGLYFDTKEEALLQAGVGLRVRLENGRWIQTMKSAGGATSGLHQRQEWECEVEEARPDFSRLPKEIKKKLFADNDLQAQIQRLFETDFERTTWQLETENGAHIELCLDEGSIRAAEHSLPLHEIELELKQGEAADLYTAALALQADIPLVLENVSKAQRGYQLCVPVTPRPLKATHLKLRKKMSAEDAFIAILWNCLEQIQGNEAAVLLGEDIEGVHQMRVGLRRLRSALSLYKPLIPSASHQALRDELRWLNSLLGPARDWDVFLQTLAQIGKNAPEQAELLDALTQRGETVRQAAYRAVQEALNSPRYSRLLLSMGEWLWRRDWRKALNADGLAQLQQPVGRFARERLSRLRKRLHRHGPQLRRLTPEERHRVRIDSKKLAYSLRFFRSLYPAHLCQALLDSLSLLRDELGTLNDAAVARGLLDVAELPADAPQRYFLSGWYAAQDTHKLADLDRAWTQFLTHKAFWKKND